MKEVLLKKVLSNVLLSPIFVLNCTTRAGQNSFLPLVYRTTNKNKPNNIGGTR
jgi:hypothetical protein